MIYFEEIKINISQYLYKREDYQYLKLFNEINYLKKNHFFYKFILIINFLVLIIFIIINKYKLNNKLNNEIKQIEKYYELCKYGILLNNQKFEKIYNPKISVISTIYNQEKYILKYHNYQHSIKNICQER